MYPPRRVSLPLPRLARPPGPRRRPPRSQLARQLNSSQASHRSGTEQSACLSKRKSSLQTVIPAQRQSRDVFSELKEEFLKQVRSKLQHQQQCSEETKSRLEESVSRNMRIRKVQLLRQLEPRREEPPIAEQFLRIDFLMKRNSSLLQQYIVDKEYLGRLCRA